MGKLDLPTTLISFYVIVSMIVLFFTIDIQSSQEAPNIEIEMIFREYTYEQLMSNADLVIIGKVIDDATSDNLNLEIENDLTLHFCSYRETELISVISGDVSQNIFVIDYFGFDGSSYYSLKDYDGLIQNETYIMFLRESDLQDNTYLPIASINSLIPVEDISKYGFDNIGLKFILSHFTSFYSNFASTSYIEFNKTDPEVVGEYIIKNEFYVELLDETLYIVEGHNKKNFVILNREYYSIDDVKIT